MNTDNSFSEINPLLNELKSEINELVDRFEKEFDRNNPNNPSIEDVKLLFKDELEKLFVYEKLKQHLLLYPVDLFYNDDDSETGIVPYAKDAISSYLTTKVQSMFTSAAH